MGWLSNDPQRILIVLALSGLMPLSIFFGRGIVRRRRTFLLDRLSQCLVDPPGRTDLAEMLDLVRARYHPRSDHGGEQRLLTVAKTAFSFMLPAVLLILVSTLALLIIWDAGIASRGGDIQQRLFLDGFQSGAAAATYREGTVLIIAVAFVSAYVWVVDYLVLRVANFDLTPIDFVRCTIHIVLSVLVATVLRHVLAVANDITQGASVALTATAVLGLVFMSGRDPAFGIRTLIDRLPSALRLRRTIPQFNAISRDLPLDLIDGIEPSIKFRLTGYEINDVQNLAMENAISLVISTPYGLARIVDWIAQSQLLLGVGPDAFLTLRGAGIRTIFDFLEAAADPAAANNIGKLASGCDANPLIGSIASSMRRNPATAHLLALRDAMQVAPSRKPKNPGTGAPSLVRQQAPWVMRKTG
ncbi:hypothetical protein NPA31_004690 [Aurantimonas sp. MSK8Z-1]|uniref:hypothetical protein n=1 Tax=Mangrovibrevibacter kandeliae TaxID=2968473 RepID=UPI002118A5AF|nr:hypothetical protein [Aurantimonas sp. MSK8Z-1]MCW4114260.1 hypothetical protein [Aurantimonas sp. MSK8Z-1]